MLIPAGGASTHALPFQTSTRARPSWKTRTSAPPSPVEGFRSASIISSHAWSSACLRLGHGFATGKRSTTCVASFETTTEVTSGATPLSPAGSLNVWSARAGPASTSAAAATSISLAMIDSPSRGSRSCAQAGRHG